MQWHNNFDFKDDNSSLIYIADNKRSVIKFYNETDTEGDFISHLGGIAFNDGFRDGPNSITLFNKPYSIIHIDSEVENYKNQNRGSKVRVLKDLGCIEKYRNDGSLDQSCILPDGDYYVESEDLIQFVYDSVQTDSQTQVESTAQSDTSNQDAKAKGFSLLIVSDSLNHCIRAIDLKAKRTVTIAGKCGEKGFKDGFLRTSRLNTPTYLGIDQKKRMYIYDSGNNYIRLLELSDNYEDLVSFVLEAKLKTLIHGSCRDISENYSDEVYQQLDLTKFRFSFCYADWLREDEGEQYFDFETIENYCTDNYATCKQKETGVPESPSE